MAETTGGQYRLCLRCGLERRHEGHEACSYCESEVGMGDSPPKVNPGALRTDLIDFRAREDGSKPILYVLRSCPVCRGLMRLSTETGRLLLKCDCRATFDPADARLRYPGCDLSGKGVIGTNMKVRNAARTIRKTGQLE